MKKLKRVISCLLMAVMVLSMTGHAVLADEIEETIQEEEELLYNAMEGDTGELPTEIANAVSQNNWRLFFRMTFSEDAGDWLNSITSVTVGETEYEKIDVIDRNARYAKNIWNSNVDDYILSISDESNNITEFIVEAEGYPTAVINLGEGVYNSGYGVTNYANPEIYGLTPDEPDVDPGEKKEILLEQVSLGTDFFGNDWILSFTDADDYVSGIQTVLVNDEEWESISYAPSSGGRYQKDESNNQLVFSKTDFSAGGSGVLKSGDVITIQNELYEDLTMKMVIDASGNGQLVEDDGVGDPYQLHIKLDGTFEAALTGQKDYDGVSSATGSASSNNNSKVTVYAALTETGIDPTEEDWGELDLQNDIQIVPDTAAVNIVPDTEGGTPAENESGMVGMYSRLSSGLTLNGTPKDPGTYLISVSLTDVQGRTAVSNALPFKIYSGEETLAELLVEENLTQTGDDLYMWKDMEPWYIKNFGSNVEGEEESVRVPRDLKAWYGSSESGLYGELGYAIPWSDVEEGNIPQTLYIPEGCNLTMVNMEIQSSVKIIVENGGTLDLRDSVVQGIIEVENGGRFKMNYIPTGKEKGFATGSSLDGQLILQDGAIIENAAIYSHTNYIANGDLTDRDNVEPVVVVNGNVTVRGQVFIEGDSAGTKSGQKALLVKDGTLTLEEGAVLAAFGGDGKTTLYYDGGAAITLDNGTITGEGKVIAMGGAPFWGNGGTAVAGTGTISTREAFLQGATAKSDGPTGEKTPGKAKDDTVVVTSPYRHIQNGTQITISEANMIEGGDPLYELYWKTGIDPTPNLENYPVEEFVLAKNTITFTNEAEKVYDGQPIVPEITADFGTDTVKYIWSTEDGEAPVNAGTYTVMASIPETAEYEAAEAVQTVVIEKATYDMSSVSFSDGEFTYDGKVKSIQIEGELPEGVTVSYTENGKTEIGSYTVTASFAGDKANYNDIEDMTASLTIVKSAEDEAREKAIEAEKKLQESFKNLKVTGVKLTPNASKKTVAISFKAVKNASYYRVAYKKNSAADWTFKTVTKTSYTLTNVAQGTDVQVRVRAFRKNLDMTAYTPYTSTARALVARPGIKSLSSSKTKTLSVSWNKISKVSGYQVSYAVNKQFTGARTKTVSSSYASTNVSTMKSNTTYYVRVRAYKTVGGTKVYGQWSTVKTVKSK